MNRPLSRREILQLCSGVVAIPHLSTAADELIDEVGITCATLAPHMKPRNPNGFSLAELPGIAAEELGMSVLDLATTNFESFDPVVLETVRKATETTGSVLTNLKMNQPGIDLGSPDPEKRAAGLKSYFATVDAAALLGMRWVRALPGKTPPESHANFLESMRRLADYSREKNLTLLIENFGWMQSDPGSVAKLIGELGSALPACPDTGNWDNDEIRYAGLAATFPLAATCDFKVKTLGPNREHGAYDLERCFRIGTAAGFRGPWCIEHGHRDREILFAELRWIRDQLKRWIAS
jgi:hypothetical protein